MRTAYPPNDKPVMVFDGNCGFCRYWIIKWKRLTQERITYSPYQEVADQYPDIPLDHFKKAVQLILPSGEVLSGAAAAYYTQRTGFWKFLYHGYLHHTLFRKISDAVYRWIADHRSFMFRLSKLFFGQKP